jgi:hypothetical protein
LRGSLLYVVKLPNLSCRYLHTQDEQLSVAVNGISLGNI